MPLEAVPGVFAVFAINAGTANTPDWVTVAEVSDFKVNKSWRTTDTSTRISQLAMESRTLMEWSLSFKIKHQFNDATGQEAGYSALYNNFIQAGSVNWLDMMVLDGPIGNVATRGIRFWGQVKQFDENQGVAENQFDDVTIVPMPARVIANNTQYGFPGYVTFASNGTPTYYGILTTPSA